MINPNSPYTCQRVGKCSYESMSNRCMYCGKTKEEILEYSMKVPNYILEMAMKVENWFIDNKIPKWRLMGMVSRNHIHTPKRKCNTLTHPYLLCRIND